MSNKLKTLSSAQLERLIAERIGKYIDEECNCTVTNLDTPYIDTEEDAAEQDKRNMKFHVTLSYKE